MLRLRLLVEMNERRNIPPGHVLHRTRRDLELLAKAFDRRLTSVQRVFNRFGGPRVPNSLTIEIDKARSLRAISATLTGILDVMRYQVCSPGLSARFL